MKKSSALSERSRCDEAAYCMVPTHEVLVLEENRDWGRGEGVGTNRWRTESLQGSETILYDAPSVETGHYTCAKVKTRRVNDTSAKP